MNAPAADPLAAALQATSEPAVEPSTPAEDFVSRVMGQLDAPDPPPEPKPAEPTVPEPKPAEPVDDIDAKYPDLDEKFSPQARANWGELKKELKAERARLRELRQQAGDPQKPQTATEVDALRKQLDSYENELSVHRIEATKAYKETVETPLRQIGEAAASLARRYELSPADLQNALLEPDEAVQQKALASLVDGMNDRDRLKVYQMADDTLLVLRKQDELHRNSRAALQELELRQKAEEERAREEGKQVFASTVDKMFSSLKDKIPFHPLEPGETPEQVLDKARRDVLGSDFDAASPDVRAYSVTAGVMLPRLVRQFRAVEAENKQLKERLAGLSSAGPRVAAGSPAPPAPRRNDAGFLEAMFAQLPG